MMQQTSTPVIRQTRVRRANLSTSGLVSSFCWPWLGLLFLVLQSVALGARAELLTQTVAFQKLPQQHEYYGRIQAVKQATAAAETQGRIETINVDIGDTVTAGSVILTITNTEQRAGLTQAEANLADAQSSLKTDQAELQRISDLVGKGFATKADLDKAQKQKDASLARVKSAEAAINTAQQKLSYTEVKAPYNGIVSDRHIEVGETVMPGTLLLSGYDPTLFRVEVDIPQQVAEQVRQYQQAHIETAPCTNSLKQYTAMCLAIEPQELIVYPTVDPATSTVRVRLNLPENTENIFPGQFVKVSFATGEAERLMVPADSVFYRSEVAAVYVVRGNKPYLRQIRVGEKLDARIEVLAGLQPGESVALDPVAAAELMAQQKASANNE